MREITKPITNPVAFEQEGIKAELWPTFQDFYDLYDRKVSRLKAETAWNKLDHETHLKIMDHVPDYVRSTPEKRYRLHPVTYLNQERWNDEIELDEKPKFSPAAQQEILRSIHGS